MNVVAHNLCALYTNNQLNKNVKSKSKSAEKLGSGYQINRAADDAAGLSISEKMRNQIRNLTQATDNVEDGISVCQVADGALSEITSIIHRMEELAVHAANDVLAQEDRDACDREVQELKKEIDKVGHDTQFNGIPLFRGREVEVGAAGTKVSDVTADKVELGFDSMNLLTDSPFTSTSGGNIHNFGVKGKDSEGIEGASWRLVYGNGSTSYPSLRLTWSDPVTGVKSRQVLKLSNHAADNGTYSFDSATNTYSRTMSLTSVESSDGIDSFSLKLKEDITLEDNGSSKYYKVNYTVLGDSTKKDFNINYDFMYNCDTAYDENDRCEGYYISGDRVASSTVYTTDSELLSTGNGNSNVCNTVPDSFSICNLENALQFTENVVVGADGARKPDTVSIGNWTRVDRWDYYENINSNVGNNIIGADLAFSFIWNEDCSTEQGSFQKSYSFKQGIAQTSSDANLQNLTVKYNDSRLTMHEYTMPMYIQHGANSGEDMKLEFEEVNCEQLGVYALSCDSREHAEDAMTQVKYALDRTNRHRSRIGAKQNRLEMICNANKNYNENLTNAESLIRDTDMATEYASFSKSNILEQAAQSMLSQANQNAQGVLSLLQ